MDRQNQQFSAPPPRPISRPTAMPIQRGNYGLPPRPVTAPPTTVAAPAQPVAPPSPPQPAISVTQPDQHEFQPVAAQVPASATPAKTGQFMDFAPSKPRMVQPLPSTKPVLPPLETETPAPSPATEQPASEAAAVPVRPLFTPTQSVVDESKPQHHKLPKQRILKTTLLGLGMLLLLVGAVRWISAGSTANDTITVGAISANDGRAMTIQFTATDGKMHKITTGSNPKYIPGTAVEIAYRSGAPEATARQVAVVKANRDLGSMIAIAGVFSLLGYAAVRGAAQLEIRRKQKHRAIPLDAAAAA